MTLKLTKTNMMNNIVKNIKAMMKINVFVILFLMVASSLSAKPMSSVSMKMGWKDSIVYDQSVTFKVEISSQISAEKMNVNVKLPAGVVFLDGQQASQVKIEKGQPLILEYSVIIEKNATGKIEVEANIGNADQVFFRAHSQLQVASPTVTKKSGSRNIVPPGFSYTERNGKKLREYKLP